MRQSPTQGCNSEKHKEEKEKEENAEEKGKARLDARNFSLERLRGAEVGDDDAVIQFGFKIANSVSQHVKASRCPHRGSTASRYLHEYMYDTWVGRLKSNWASACKQSLRGLRLRDASFSLMCRDARCLSRPF